MAINSCVLNLQDFIKTPVKVFPVRGFLPKTNQNQDPRKNQNNYPENFETDCIDNLLDSLSQTEIYNCPFDCCQKNLQTKYFSDSELTNVTLKMRIGNSPGNQVKGVPCLERRTIYEGRVSGPVRFGELEFMKNNANSNENANFNQLEGNERIVIADNRDNLKLTFHKDTPAPVTPRETMEYRNLQTGQTHYVWDSLRGGWALANQQHQQNSSAINTNKDIISDGRPRCHSFTAGQTRTMTHHAPPVDHAEFWKYYNASAKNQSNLWRQQQQQHLNQQNQLQLQQQQQQQLQLHQQAQMSTVTRINPPPQSQSCDYNNAKYGQGGRPASTISMSPPMQNQNQHQKEDFIDQQLNNHLRMFKYIKPSATNANNANANYMSTSPPSATNSNEKALAHLSNKSKVNFKQKASPGPGLECRTGTATALSPRAALEQYEKLKKYWDYQHQILANSFAGDSMEVTPYSYTSSNNNLPTHTMNMSGTGSQSQNQAQIQGQGSSVPTANYSYQQALYIQQQQMQSHIVQSRNQYMTVSDGANNLNQRNSIQNQHQQRYSISGVSGHPGPSGLVDCSTWTACAGGDGISRRHSMSYKRKSPGGEAMYTNYAEGGMMTQNQGQRPKVLQAKIITEKQSYCPIQPKPSPTPMQNQTQQAQTPPQSEFRPRVNSASVSVRREVNNTNKPEAQEVNSVLMISTPPTGNTSGKIVETITDTQPTDLSVRRNSDQDTSKPPTPERSKSVGVIDTSGYDHIVLLDKRVMTFMCKRCLETLKSEQDIRNHLFCKMLNNTVQCHICRNFCSTDDYSEHLKAHGVKNT